jgi:hypothetical protein
VKAHKFKVGQLVGFGVAGGKRSSPLSFKILAQVPSNERGPQYRIKGSSEAFERTANETELYGLNPSDN